jgi:putative acetyltransferase
MDYSYQKGNMNVEIRPESEDDYKATYEVNTLAFEQENEARLVDLLRNSEAFIPELSLVATIDNQVVGHILFTRIKIIDENLNEFDSLALAPMAVRPGFQNQGIGGRLIRKGLETAAELNFRSIIVLGHEHYYPKFGFAAADQWNIKAPFDVPRAAFMGIELVKGGLKNVRGTVKYPKEFERV